MPKFVSLAVGNLRTNDPWADKMIVQVWSDAALTQLVGAKVTGISAKLQHDPIIFKNLILGGTYWVTAKTVISSTGAASANAVFEVLAGNAVPPNVTYSLTVQQTVAGMDYTIVPVSGVPSDIDHYEYSYNKIGAPPPVDRIGVAPLWPNAHGELNVFVGAVGGSNVTMYVRAVNTSGIKQPWVNLSTALVPNQMKVEVRAVGQYAYAAGATRVGLFINDAPSYNFTIGGVTGPAFRGYNMATINKTTMRVDFIQNYDTASNPNAADAMRIDINTLAANRIFIIWTYLEPSVNRLGFGLPAELYSIGASRQVFGSSKFRVCGAYILVGETFLGQGNGIEAYSGNVDLDPLAAAEVIFYIHNGNVIGYNGRFPASTEHNPVTGDIAATGSIPPSLNQGFTYSATTTTITWSWNLNLYRADLPGTVKNYVGSQLITGLSPNTQYFYYPYLDETTDTVKFVTVNDVPGAVTGTPFISYAGVNYQVTQFAQRQDHIPLSTAPMHASTTSTGSGTGSAGGSGVCLDAQTIVLEKEKGYIPLLDVELGDWLDSPQGWVQVNDITFADEDLWIEIDFEGGDTVASTTQHEYVDWNNQRIPACKISLLDYFNTKLGVTSATAIRLSRRNGRKCRVQVDSPEHLIYVGWKCPVVTSNLQSMPC